MEITISYFFLNIFKILMQDLTTNQLSSFLASLNSSAPLLSQSKVNWFHSRLVTCLHCPEVNQNGVMSTSYMRRYLIPLRELVTIYFVLNFTSWVGRLITHNPLCKARFFSAWLPWNRLDFEYKVRSFNYRMTGSEYTAERKIW